MLFAIFQCKTLRGCGSGTAGFGCKGFSSSVHKEDTQEEASARVVPLSFC